ncbi:hypothetical protein V8E54_010487 [Elaphomyces granulatus]|jgi:hypothetical protein
MQVTFHTGCQSDFHKGLEKINKIDGKGKLPDEHITDNVVFEAPGLSTDSPSKHCQPSRMAQTLPKGEWHFVSKSVCPGIKGHLGDIRLTLYVRNPSMVKSQPTNYRNWIPQKLRDKLKIKTSLGEVPGWGPVVYLQFDYFVFWCMWGCLAFVLSLSLLLGLYVAESGPIHGQVGAAVGIFLAPWGLLGTVFSGVCGYAKQKGYLE